MFAPRANIPVSLSAPIRQYRELIRHARHLRESDSRERGLFLQNSLRDLRILVMSLLAHCPHLHRNGQNGSFFFRLTQQTQSGEWKLWCSQCCKALGLSTRYVWVCFHSDGSRRTSFTKNSLCVISKNSLCVDGRSSVLRDETPDMCETQNTRPEQDDSRVRTRRRLCRNRTLTTVDSPDKSELDPPVSDNE